MNSIKFNGSCYFGGARNSAKSRCQFYIGFDGNGRAKQKATFIGQALRSLEFISPGEKIQVEGLMSMVKSGKNGKEIPYYLISRVLPAFDSDIDDVYYD